MRLVFQIYILIFSSALFSQFSVSGYVLDSNSKEPLLGVSVYYDGSTIGTITNKEGYFELNTSKRITGNLIFNFLGYQTIVLSKVKKGSLGTIFLVEKPVELEEVILLPDTWSRAKKLTIFRKEFLGTTVAGSRCKILNEDDIRLYYNSEENRLYAFAEKPIIILNSYLGYKISYTLVNFEANFYKLNSLPVSTKSSYMAGLVFFKELNANKLKRKYLRNRRKTYFGSGLHLMRSIANQNLTENNFSIFKNGSQVNPREVFSIQKIEDQKQIIQEVSKLAILYKQKDQSIIQVKKNPFFIDSYGNFNPIRNVIFGGKIGALRIGDILPLDYAVN